MGWLGGLFGLLGNVVGGIFGMKNKQGDVVQKSLEVLGDVNASSGQREQAVATIIASENSSGSWLSASWRPLTMLVFLGMLVSYWFGYAPEGLLRPDLPPMLAELFGLIKLGLGGYMGARTLEKIVQQVNIGLILKRFVEKKLL